MAIDPVTAILNIGGTLIDRLIPDKSANAAAKAQLTQIALQGDMQNAVAQLQVDQAEAQNGSIFVAGWRPFLGWSCGAAFVYNYILQPLIVTTLVVFHSNFNPALLPHLDLTQMIPILGGMLGLGGMRTVEKLNGVDTKSIGS